MFTRLRGGRLWNADPLRQAVIDLLANQQRDLDFYPPQQVIEHIRGVDSYDPVEGASGPCFDLDTRTREILDEPGSMVILIGPRGAHKDLFRRRLLFVNMAKTSVNSQPNVPTPVLLHLCDLVGNEAEAERWGVLQRIWRRKASDGEIERVKDREFVFLINGEEEAWGCAKADAVDAIDRLRRSLPSCRILLVADDQLLPILKDRPRSNSRSKPILLAIQELQWAKVSAFLEEQQREEENQKGSTNSGVSERLRQQIFDHGLTDLTTQPKFLQFMRSLVEDDYEDQVSLGRDGPFCPDPTCPKWKTARYPESAWKTL